MILTENLDACLITAVSVRTQTEQTSANIAPALLIRFPFSVL